MLEHARELAVEIDYGDWPRPAEWYAAKVRQMAERRKRPAEGTWSGRGIVTVGGGDYYASAYVLIRLLRELGCELPVECWHLGDSEMTDRRAELLRGLDVEVRDVKPLMENHPDCQQRGWAAKAFAIVHSRFREVLFLDADNMPTRDPSFLFESRPYGEHGAVFWPDVAQPPEDVVYDVLGLEPDTRCWESGQMLMDKRRCWPALQLAWWMNRHSRFFYRHMYGDKDTFPLAWRRMGYDWAGPEVKGQHRDAILQYDFRGRVLFQHRCRPKWSLRRTVKRLPELRHEWKCHCFLGDLRAELGVSHTVSGHELYRGRPRRVVVCGPPSSGTTFLNKIVRRFPGVSSTHELNVFGAGSNALLGMEDWAEDVFERLVDRLAEMETSGGPGELTPRMRSFADSIRRGGMSAEKWMGEIHNDRATLLYHLEDTLWKGQYRMVGDKFPRYSFCLAELCERTRVDCVVIALRNPFQTAVSWRNRGHADSLPEALQHTVDLANRLLGQLQGVRQQGIEPIVIPYGLYGVDGGPSEVVERLSDGFGYDSGRARPYALQNARHSRHPGKVLRMKRAADDRLVMGAENVHMSYKKLGGTEHV